MDRIINIKVGGNYITKDSKIAGVRGEANVTKLHIIFDSGWSGYAKKVTFRDAVGANPVYIDLLPHMHEVPGDESTPYVVPIPAEPLAIAGDMTFVIDGTSDDGIPRSVPCNLEVLYAPADDEAQEPEPPTPSELEQVRAELENIKGDIRDTANAVEATEGIKSETEGIKNQTEQTASAAISAMNSILTGAETARDAAMGYRNDALAAKNSIETQIENEVKPELDMKLDKKTNATDEAQAYLKNRQGGLTMANVTTTPYARTIPYRNDDGNITIGTDGSKYSNNSAVSKKYVDEKFLQKYPFEWRHKIGLGTNKQDTENGNVVTKYIKLASFTKMNYVNDGGISIDIDSIGAGNNGSKNYTLLMFINTNKIENPILTGANDKDIANKIFIRNRLMNGTDTIDVYYETDEWERAFFHIKSTHDATNVFEVVDSIPSDATLHPKNILAEALDKKVDSVSGKGLSTNDFTNANKTLLEKLGTFASQSGYIDVISGSSFVIGKEEYGLFFIQSKGCTVTYTGNNSGVSKSGKFHLFVKAKDKSGANWLYHAVVGSTILGADFLNYSLSSDITITENDGATGRLVKIPMKSPDTGI